MASRWIGTRCRPIDISDAVGYLIGCVRTRGRAGGEFGHPVPSRKEQPAEGVANRSSDRLRPEFSAARMSSAAPTRETGVEEQPAEGVELFSGRPF